MSHENTVRFRDRADAGRQLAAQVAQRRFANPIVLGLPRGGVPVAAAVAQTLGAPLDVIVVRKLGVPFAPEVAMGAIGEGGVGLVDGDLVDRLGIRCEDVDAVHRAENVVLAERSSRLRRLRPVLDLTGHTAIVVDDGIATGATMAVACRVARRRGATRVIAAAPVAADEVIRGLDEADEVVTVMRPLHFGAVGEYYDAFAATPDDTVESLLVAGAGAATSPTTQTGAVP
ncbi:phosphoribosyltransferase [Curtobacterium ammoniigenes]|uniref:phosphoribosyltransferase n=1 Tax=Curtobacterium ammoniigenes TaxID=395387 RepID=UPI000834E919|nr:phosphoribosyltransferase family protein [Curtobacterium ammoniigenes]